MIALEPRRLARLAGALYLAMMPFGFFAIVYVPSILPVSGDPGTIVQQVAAAEALIRAGTASHFIGQILFLALVLTLYRLLQGVSSAMAVAMVMLATIGIPITLYNEVHYLSALRLVHSGVAEGWTPAQQAALILQQLSARASGITLSQVFWGLWLLPLGRLVMRAGYFPRVIGLLLILAGVGYLIDVAIQLLLPGSTIRVSTFTFIGEVVFPLWLLIRGVPGAAEGQRADP